AADDRILAARLIKLRRDEGVRLEPRDPAAASGAPAAPIAVAPPAAASFEQPATHRQPSRAEFELAEDPQPPVRTGRPSQRGVPVQAPPIERGEE
ncbi:MAG: hypothetical protein JNG90_09570, partial [Planctomycetaceae bacterium]|nr:hypothetical protein [Planctomycetaceae bacterium]